MNENTKVKINEEKIINPPSGMASLIIGCVLLIAAILAIIYAGIKLDAGENPWVWGWVLGIACFWVSLPGWLFFGGLKIVNPNEAYVFTLFGNYYGTINKEGFYFVNPFVTAVNPGRETAEKGLATNTHVASGAINLNLGTGASALGGNKKMSLKAMTLDNNTQKINDSLGNPIIIGIVVIWRVRNTAMAAFNVDNYREYLSIQTDSALRNIVRLYPYDLPGEEEGEKSLRGSSQEISDKIKDEIQKKADIAGLEIIEARITHLSYAPEIAAAMLQRQQAGAVVDARQLIVEGAVGMVEMALSRLNEKEIVKLDEERKAQMVSNLLVVLCANKETQPVVNSGTLY